MRVDETLWSTGRNEAFQHQVWARARLGRSQAKHGSIPTTGSRPRAKGQAAGLSAAHHLACLAVLVWPSHCCIGSSARSSIRPPVIAHEIHRPSAHMGRARISYRMCACTKEPGGPLTRLSVKTDEGQHERPTHEYEDAVETPTQLLAITHNLVILLLPWTPPGPTTDSAARQRERGDGTRRGGCTGKGRPRAETDRQGRGQNSNATCGL